MTSKLMGLGACVERHVLNGSTVFVGGFGQGRRFVAHVNHVTSPVYLNGGAGRRRKAELPGGPAAVVTSEAAFTFEDECLTLAAVVEGRSPESVLEGFSIPVRRLPIVAHLMPLSEDIVEQVRKWTIKTSK